MWAPTDRLQPRGRTLRRDGKFITDIDALGERGGTVLLVSCESVPFSAAYGRGEDRAIEAIVHKANEAIVAWADETTSCASIRFGENYDLSWATEII
jgi:hypothetical protein